MQLRRNTYTHTHTHIYTSPQYFQHLRYGKADSVLQISVRLLVQDVRIQPQDDPNRLSKPKAPSFKALSRTSFLQIPSSISVINIFVSVTHFLSQLCLPKTFPRLLAVARTGYQGLCVPPVSRYLVIYMLSGDRVSSIWWSGTWRRPALI